MPPFNGSVKFNVNCPLTQLLELDRTVDPLNKVAVIFVAVPPTGVTTAKVIEVRFTVSGLELLTVY